MELTRVRGQRLLKVPRPLRRQLEVLAHRLHHLDAQQGHEDLAELQGGVAGVVEVEAGDGVGGAQGDEQEAHGVAAHHPEAVVVEVAQAHAPEGHGGGQHPGD